MDKFNYKYDEKVTFNNGPIQGTGLIKGVSTTAMPVLGVTYIVQVTNGLIPNESYPYDCMVVSECHLKHAG